MSVGGPLGFEVTSTSRVCGARTGVVTTPHGSFETPCFMPVGTKGTVKGITPDLVRRLGSNVLLNNTYHMMLRPGAEIVAELGGAHRFMGWDGVILTDSGGYQAYSMADTNAIDDDGVTFRSIMSGEAIRMTPEHSMRVQNLLGADIIMAFDDCPPSIDPRARTVNQSRLRVAAERDASPSGYDHNQRLDVANERTVRWLERCKRAHARASDQALFGIVQGGTDLERRSWSAERVCGVELPGYAIGGVAVGEPHEAIVRVVEHTAPLLPSDKPRYLMGVGYERDIVAAVRAGIDMFDCVLPTRNGRSGNAFTRFGQVRLKNSEHARSPEVIEPGCDCPACDPARHGWPMPFGAGGDRPGFSRAYLRHLFASKEMLGPILVSLHNLRHFQRLTSELRAAIRSDDWMAFASRWPVAAGACPSGGAPGESASGA